MVSFAIGERKMRIRRGGRTVVLADEMKHLFGRQFVERAPDKVLYSGFLRRIDEVLAVLGLVVAGLGLRVLMLGEEGPDCTRRQVDGRLTGRGIVMQRNERS